VSSAQYPEFEEETSDALQSVKAYESTNLSGDINAHIGAMLMPGKV